MDLVCGYETGLMGSTTNVIKKTSKVLKENKAYAIINSVDSRSKYELANQYGVDFDKAIQWAVSMNQPINTSNLGATLKAFKTFQESMAKRDSSIGRSMAEGVKQRDEQFKRLGWKDYNEFSKARAEIGSGAPNIFPKTFYLSWIQGQKQINIAREQANRASSIKRAQGIAQRDVYLENKATRERKQALEELGLKSSNMLPIAIAGVGALLLLK